MTTAAPACHVPPAASIEIDMLLADLVARWHAVEPAHAEIGLCGKVCDLHRFNFLLWHEEDIARAPDVTDARIATVKRAILELRRYHMREQAERTDATTEHRAKAAARMEVLDAQRDHLVESLDRLLGEIFCAQRPLRVFRQMKMYNDPTMNPYLYQAGKAA